MRRAAQLALSSGRPFQAGTADAAYTSIGNSGITVGTYIFPISGIGLLTPPPTNAKIKRIKIKRPTGSSIPIDVRFVTTDSGLVVRSVSQQITLAPNAETDTTLSTPMNLFVNDWFGIWLASTTLDNLFAYGGGQSPFGYYSNIKINTLPVVGDDLDVYGWSAVSAPAGNYLPGIQIYGIY